MFAGCSTVTMSDQVTVAGHSCRPVELPLWMCTAVCRWKTSARSAMGLPVAQRGTYQAIRWSGRYHLIEGLRQQLSIKKKIVLVETPTQFDAEFQCWIDCSMLGHMHVLSVCCMLSCQACDQACMLTCDTCKLVLLKAPRAIELKTLFRTG